MIKKFLSIRPTIFAGVLAFTALSLAACSPVAIMMPEGGAIDQAAMPDQSSSNSLADESIAVASDTASNPDVNAYGYYVRALGYLADESNAGVSDAASNPDVFAYGYYVRSPGEAAEESIAEESEAASNPDVFADGYYVRAPGYMAEEPAVAEIDVAATPYHKPLGSAGNDVGGMESASSELLLMVANDPVLGAFLVDSRGMTLYMFTKDEPGKINCTGNCLQAWPPLLAFGSTVAGEGVDASLIGKATLPGGLAVLTYNGMPLYYWQDDMQPGDTKGQSVNGVWFVVSPDGEPVGM